MERSKRIINIFMAPTDVFKDLKGKSDWLIPLLLILVISLVLSIWIIDITIPAMIDEIHGMTEMPVEQREQMLSYYDGIFPYVTGAIGGLFGISIVFIIMAGILTLIRFVFGGDKLPFKNIFTGVVYVGIITIPASLFAALITYSTGEVSTGLTLGLFLPNLSGYLGRLLSGISFFGIWQVVLYSILLMVFYNYSKKKAFSIMFGLYLLWIFVSSLLYFVPGF